MATAHAHHRTPSHPKRPSQSHPRVARPAPLKRAGKSQTKVPQRKDDDPEDDLMAASFLNFCTVCEKQIIVPNNSILYCSESCRKKDNTKTITFEPSPPPTPYTRYSFEDVSPSRDIIPPRSPTVAPAKRLSYGYSETSDDETPEWTEEKPKESEATRYLRTFSCTDMTAQRTRPNYHRSSTSTVVSTTSTAPSLSHTPTSSVSISMPYTPSSRPLPRRNPNGSSYGTRSIDLVNPFTAVAVHPTTAPSSLTQWSLKSGPSCQTSTGIAAGELELFEKKIPNAASPSQGSLKQLFAFSAMQAPPSSTASTMRSAYS
ncbi:life-span regulatory factor [Botryosphaeria dothidea]|uniref:Life-span regulatory factor n=1 Tax=Botryosphaeria dothidea TaxID=55169 RepID=A0A8H4IRA4_9PEZI|nr:life-span regulatory factor [Botryosphaeria dothidea]KAF4305867.1 life-span regulatory factor [Botryosphaeria dothidea]